jgi:hypothetical protein
MPQPDADYEIDLDESELAPADQEALRQLREDQRLREEREQVDRQLAVIQGRAAEAADPAAEVNEGVVVATGDTVEMMGKKFRVADKVGLMPLLKFASASDMNTADPRALSAIYDMLKDCIHPGYPACGTCPTCRTGNEESCKAYDPGDWGLFERHAIDTKAEADDLIPVVSQVMEIISGRPTAPRDGSSTGQRASRGSSTGNSSGRRGRASKR